MGILDGDMITEVRRLHKLSQRDLAYLMNVDLGDIKSVESGRRRLAGTMEKRFRDLFEGTLNFIALIV